MSHILHGTHIGKTVCPNYYMGDAYNLKKKKKVSKESKTTNGLSEIQN